MTDKTEHPKQSQGDDDQRGGWLWEFAFIGWIALCAFLVGLPIVLWILHKIIKT